MAVASFFPPPLRSLTPPVRGASSFRTNGSGRQRRSAFIRLGWLAGWLAGRTRTHWAAADGAWLRRVTAWDRDVRVGFRCWHVFVMLVFWSRHCPDMHHGFDA